MNTITIDGFLGKSAEVRQTKSGKTVTNLTLAHTPREKRDGEWIDGETLWFKIPVWDDLPPIMFDKGTRVIVSGVLHQESYEHEGEKRVTLVIKYATVGIVHRLNANSDNATPVTDDWAMPVNPQTEAIAPF
jgi:single-strand DNA-binding protein